MANAWNWGDQLDDEDNEGDNEDEGGSDTFQQWGSRDGLIFLIDCNKQMFDKTGEEGSAFDLCIRCAKNVMQNKIISSDKDMMGIVFFATEKSKNMSDFKSVFVFEDLCIPGAESVLQLEDLLNKPENNSFDRKIGHTTDFSLGDALWTCSMLFSNCREKLGYKRVLLFTNCDNPHGNNKQLKSQAIAKADDLHQNGIGLELMHINPVGQVFDVNLFYKDIMFGDEDENVLLADPADKFDELLTRVRYKDHKKRAQCRIPFSLGEGINMSIGVYNLVRSVPVPYGTKLYKKDNTEVKTVTKTFLQETGEILMPQDMKKAVTYGGRQIFFENDEATEIKLFDKPGLKLMGFKPSSAVKKYFHVRPAQFIYPDETSISGSTTMFTALLKKCLEKKVVAICRYIPRRNTPPRFVALSPQEEVLDDHKVQLTPPGFHVLFLPFADDFRKLTFEEGDQRATTEQIDKAKELIKKLAFNFNSENFENPRLQHHYANVEAMALDRDAPEEVIDYTMPDAAKMDKRAGSLIEEFKSLVFPQGYQPNANKRVAASKANDEDKVKKPKADENDEVDIDIEKEARDGRLSKLTVPLLKQCVKKAKIKATGTKKADLIDAINAHFGIS